MISTVHRGQILISGEQIRKQKWLVYTYPDCAVETHLSIPSAALAGVHCLGKRVGNFQPRKESLGIPGGRKREQVAMFQLRRATACSLPVNRTNARDRVLAGRAALVLSSSVQQEGSRSRSSPGKQPGWLRACCSNLPPAP